MERAARTIKEFLTGAAGGRSRRQLLGESIVDDRLADPTSLAAIPLLRRTVDAFGGHEGLTDLGSKLSELAVEDLIDEAQGDIAAVIDLATTVEAWSDGADHRGAVLRAMPHPERLAEYGLMIVRELHRARGEVQRPRSVESIYYYLGLDGYGRRTLAEAGELVGVTRERVRQLKEKVLPTNSWERTWPAPPHLRVSVREVAAAIALGNDPSSIIAALGTEETPFSNKGLLAWCDICGVRTSLERSHDGKLRDVSIREPRFDATRAAIWKASRNSGFAHVRAVEAVLAEDERGFADDDLAGTMSADPETLELGAGVYYWAPHVETTITSTTLRMLTVTSPLDFDDVYGGIMRRFTVRKLPIPSREIARNFYAQFPVFQVDPGGLISAVGALPEPEETIQTQLVEILRSARDHVMARDEIMSECRRRRLNATSVGIYLSYGEQVHRVGPGIFAPVGVHPPDEIVDRVRSNSQALRTRLDRTERYEDGQPILEVLLNSSAINSGVLSVTTAFARALGDSKYELTDDEGSSFGNVGLSRGTMLFGFLTLFSAIFPEPGDVLVLRFDLAEGRVTAQVGGDELLDEDTE